MPEATFLFIKTAPRGKPPPMPLAIGTMSGSTFEYSNEKKDQSGRRSLASIIDTSDQVIKNLMDGWLSHVLIAESDIEAWDSLNHLNIVSAVEREFRIKFALGELADLKNISNVVDLVYEKINK